MASSNLDSTNPPKSLNFIPTEKNNIINIDLTTFDGKFTRELISVERNYSFSVRLPRKLKSTTEQANPTIPYAQIVNMFEEFIKNHAQDIMGLSLHRVSIKGFLIFHSSHFVNLPAKFGLPGYHPVKVITTTLKHPTLAWVSLQNPNMSEETFQIVKHSFEQFFHGIAYKGCRIGSKHKLINLHTPIEHGLWIVAREIIPEQLHQPQKFKDSQSSALIATSFTACIKLARKPKIQLNTAVSAQLKDARPSTTQNQPRPIQSSKQPTFVKKSASAPSTTSSVDNSMSVDQPEEGEITPVTQLPQLEAEQHEQQQQQPETVILDSDNESTAAADTQPPNPPKANQASTPSPLDLFFTPRKGKRPLNESEAISSLSPESQSIASNSSSNTPNKKSKNTSNAKDPVNGSDSGTSSSS